MPARIKENIVDSKETLVKQEKNADVTSSSNNNNNGKELPTVTLKFKDKKSSGAKKEVPCKRCMKLFLKSVHAAKSKRCRCCLEDSYSSCSSCSSFSDSSRSSSSSEEDPSSDEYTTSSSSSSGSMDEESDYDSSASEFSSTEE